MICVKRHHCLLSATVKHTKSGAEKKQEIYIKMLSAEAENVPIMPKMWVLTGGKYIERGEGKEEFAAKVPNWR